MVFKPGVVTNPTGNPTISFPTNRLGKKGGLDAEGKFKMSVKNGTMQHGDHSKTLSKFYKCNGCPLKPRVDKAIVNGEWRDIYIPSRCPSYKPKGKCVYSQIEFIKKMKYYYEIMDKEGTLALQEALTFQILEDAQMAREQETITERRPGQYTNKHTELAVKNLESVNKLKYGEKHTNTNVNVDITQEIIDGYERIKKRKEEDGIVQDMQKN